MAAMGLFTIGTVLCGLSRSFPTLLIFRMIQGSGTGMLLPILIHTIMQIYPPEQRGVALGKGLTVVVVAPALGPTLAGLILSYMDWYWLFFLMLPIMLAAIILAKFFLVNVSEMTKPRIDVLSIVYSTFGFGGIIFAVGSIESLGIFNPVVLTALGCSVLGLILFIKRQFVLEQPMLELRAFQYPVFVLGSILLLISFMVPFAVGIIVPIFVQNVLGDSAFIAGLIFLPGGIICGICTPLSGAHI